MKHRPKQAAIIALALVMTLGGCSSTTPRSAISTAIEDPRATAIATVQNYLAGEHAAIWAYGRATAMLPEAEATTALATAEKHKQERDRLARELRAAGVTPVGALVAYDEGVAIESAEQARTFLAGIEARLLALALAVKNIPSKP